MTPADSPSRSDLASLPTVLHGNTNGSDEPQLETDSRPTGDGPELQGQTPSSPSTDPRATPSPTTASPASSSGPESPTSRSSTTSGSSDEPPLAHVSIAAGVGAVGEHVIDAMALPMVQALGVLANRGYYRRTGEPSSRWLFTADEAEALAGAVGRISARRLPEQLVEGEGGDLFVIVGVTGGYLVRNALGISEAQMAQAAADRGPVSPPDQARPAAPVHEGAPPAPAPADGDLAGARTLSAADVGAV